MPLFTKTGSSTWSPITQFFVKTATSTWAPVKKAYVKTAGLVWTLFYPQSGPYTTVSPYFSTDQAGNNTIQYPYGLFIGNSLYLQRGTWNSNSSAYPTLSYTYTTYGSPNGDVTFQPYAYPIENNITLTNSYVKLDLINNPYDNTYVTGLIKATRSDGVYSTDTTDSFGFRVFIYKNKPVNTTAPSWSLSGNTLTYTSAWNANNLYLPNILKSTLSFYSNTTNSTSGGNLIKTYTGLTNASTYNGTTYVTTASIDITSYAGLYIYAVESQENSGTNYNNGSYVPSPVYASPQTAYGPISLAPQPPTNLTATDVGTNRPYNNGAIYLSWQAPTSGSTPAGYKIYYYTPGAGSYLPWSSNTYDTSSTSITLTGFTSNTNYSFYLLSIGSSGTPSTTNSNTASATATTVPQAPTSVTASAVGGGQALTIVNAGNTGGQPITSYTVTSSGGQSASSSSNSLYVSGMTNGVQYTFTATATNSNGTSTSSSASSSIYIYNIGSVTVNSSSSTTSSITLNYTAASNSTSTRTYISTSLYDSVSTTAGNNYSYTFPNLSSGTSYSLGLSGIELLSGTTYEGPKTYGNYSTTALPNPPTNLTATDVGTNRSYNNGAITLQWSAPTTGGPVSGYKIYYYTAGAGSYLPWSSNAYDTSSTSITLTGFTSNTNYSFQLKSVGPDGSVSTSYSNTASATATTVPQAPTIGSANAYNGGYAYVTFSANGTGGQTITSYTVTSNPGGYTGSGSSSGIYVYSLSNGVQYNFYVTATNSNGTSTTSGYSNTIYAYNIGTPTINSSSSTFNSITVNFTPGTNSTGTRAYLNGSLDGTTSTGSYTFSGLTAGTSYSIALYGSEALGGVTYLGSPATTNLSTQSYTAPTITASVSPTSGTAGSTTYFASSSVTGNPTPTVTYYWQYLTSGWNTYTTGSSFSPASNINSATGALAWRLYAVATNSAGSASSSASFTINNPVVQTASVSTITGDTYSSGSPYYAQFTISGSNIASFNFTIYASNSSTGSATGSTSGSTTGSTAQTGNKLGSTGTNAYYWIVVTPYNSAGTAGTTVTSRRIQANNQGPGVSLYP